MKPWKSALDASYKEVDLDDDVERSPAEEIAALTKSVRKLKRWLLAIVILFVISLVLLLHARHSHIQTHLLEYFPWSTQNSSPFPDFGTVRKYLDQDPLLSAHSYPSQTASGTPLSQAEEKASSRSRILDSMASNLASRLLSQIPKSTGLPSSTSYIASST
jgi:hypothetical protein